MASHVSAYSAASSALYQSTIASTGIQTETFSDRLTQTKHWLYNPEDGAVMGRTPSDWLKYISCIIVFLIALFGMSATFCTILYWAVGWNHPTQQGANSILQVLGIVDTCLYLISQYPSELGRRRDTLQVWEKIQALTRTFSTQVELTCPSATMSQTIRRTDYENELQVGDRYKDCSEIRRRRTEELDKVCVFDPIVLGGDCVKQQNYGFDDGQPCILLKLNKIHGWMPEEFTPETVPPLIKDDWDSDDPWWIHVRCDGDDDATRENMGDLSYFPQQGFHYKYFPFLNQQGYRSPLMFLRFENPHPGFLLMMTCRAFARNIIHDRVEQLGLVHFEVIVD